MKTKKTYSIYLFNGSDFFYGNKKKRHSRQLDEQTNKQTNKHLGNLKSPPGINFWANNKIVFFKYTANLILWSNIGDFIGIT